MFMTEKVAGFEIGSWDERHGIIIILKSCITKGHKEFHKGSQRENLFQRDSIIKWEIKDFMRDRHPELGSGSHYTLFLDPLLRCIR